MKELGQTAFAITDHGTVSGLMEGYKEVAKLNSKMEKDGDPFRLKFIFGCEAYFVPDVTIKTRKNCHLILLAKNLQGYHNLLKLMTIANKEENFYFKPRIDMDILRKYKEGIIVTSACMGGILNLHDTMEDEDISVWNKQGAYNWAKAFKDEFGEDYFIELHTNQMADQIVYNERMVKLAQELDIPLLAAVDSHYVHESQAKVHRQWIGIEEDNEGSYYGTDDYFIMSEAEVEARLSYLPKDVVRGAIRNTSTVADRCNVELDKGKKNYPIFPVTNQVEHLKAICREGWKEKINKKVAPADRGRYLEALNHEFEVLEAADYINYFLITHDVLSWCVRNGIRIGKGRGSVVGSLCAYLMGLTKVDPLKYNLLFQRFCHLSRVTPPDIDSDVPTSRRQEVIDYIRQQYGEVFQARTFGMMKAKGALKKAGEALRMNPQDIKILSKTLNLADDDEEEEEKITDFQHQLNALDKIKTRENAELIELAKAFVGIINTYSVHASAVIVFYPIHSHRETGR